MNLTDKARQVLPGVKKPTMKKSRVGKVVGVVALLAVAGTVVARLFGRKAENSTEDDS